MSTTYGDPAALEAALAQVPIDQIYDFAQHAVDEITFPAFGAWFWGLAYLAVALWSVIILLMLSAFAIRFKRGSLKWVMQDGNATRLHYVPAIAVLYTIDAAALICFTFVLRRDLYTKRWSEAAGRFWFTCHLPLVLSWSFLMIHVLASSPPIRRMLAGWSRRKSLAFLNGILFLLVAGVTIGIFFPAVRQGRVFAQSQLLYEEITQIIEQAKAAQNPLMLYAIREPAEGFLPQVQDMLDAIRMGGILWFVNGSLCLVCGILPAYALSAVVRRKIARYESGSSSTNWSSSQGEMPTIHIPLQPGQDIDSVSPEQTPDLSRRTFKIPVNKDAPFSNVVPIKTTLLPAQFQEVIDANMESREKAVRLRALLRQEQLQLISYALLIISFYGMTGFMAFNGEAKFDTRSQICFNYIYSCWAFIVPALPTAILFLKSSFSHSVPRMTGKQKDNAPMPTGIVLTQVLSIAEDVNTTPYEEEKKLRF